MAVTRSTGAAEGLSVVRNGVHAVIVRLKPDGHTATNLEIRSQHRLRFQPEAPVPVVTVVETIYRRPPALLDRNCGQVRGAWRGGARPALSLARLFVSEMASAFMGRPPGEGRAFGNGWSPIRPTSSSRTSCISLRARLELSRGSTRRRLISLRAEAPARAGCVQKSSLRQPRLDARQIKSRPCSTAAPQVFFHRQGSIVSTASSRVPFSSTTNPSPAISGHRSARSRPQARLPAFVDHARGFGAGGVRRERVE